MQDDEGVEDEDVLPAGRNSQRHSWSGIEPPALTEAANQVVRIFCGVWNLHGKVAPSDLSPWLGKTPTHHIYVVGTCECERSIEKSMFWADKSRFETQIRDHFGEDYRLIRSHNMSAIHVMVMAHRSIGGLIWDIRSAQVATGLGNFIGNKGGVQIGFCVGHTSLLFTNAHLAAHANKMGDRTKNHARILVDSPLRRSKANAGVHEDYDHVFFMGDLNPRISARRSQVDAWLAEERYDECLARDQLLPLLRGGTGALSASGHIALGIAAGGEATDTPHAADGTGSNPLSPRSDDDDDEDAEGDGELCAEVSACPVVGSVGLWPAFDEQQISFPPTYKFDAGTDSYDSSKKQRVPSWTDRILWKRDTEVTPLAYGSVGSMRRSDHKPIFAQFEAGIDMAMWSGPPTQQDKKSAACVVQ